jgi:hypothetical protein
VTEDHRDEGLLYCAVPRRPDPVLPPGLDVDRSNAILLGRAMWANGIGLEFREVADRSEAEVRIGFMDLDA